MQRLAVNAAGIVHTLFEQAQNREFALSEQTAGARLRQVDWNNVVVRGRCRRYATDQKSEESGECPNDQLPELRTAIHA